MHLGRAVQVPVARRAGYEPGIGQAVQRVRDRRTLGGHELPEQPMGERQRQADPGGLDATPARGEMPEEQIETDLEAGVAGDGTHRVDIGSAPGRPAQQHLDDLRPWAYALDEFAVEQRELRRPEDLADVGPFEHRLGAQPDRLDQIAGTDKLGGGPVADVGLEGDQAFEDEQPEAGSDNGVGRAEIALANLGLKHAHSGALSDGDPGPDVELVGKVVIGVKQIGVDSGGTGPASG